MAFVTVKLYNGDDVRRTRIPEDAPYAKLEAVVHAAFGKHGFISWIDEDGDAVNIRTDSDWSEAVRAFDGKVVKLNFTARNHESKTSIPVPADKIGQNQAASRKLDEAKLPNDGDRESILTAPRSNTPKKGALGTSKSSAESKVAMSSAVSKEAMEPPKVSAVSSTVDSPTNQKKQPEPEPPCAVHYGVECDASGENPITGTRYHLIHYDYDLNETEFRKLSEEQQKLFEAISHPGAEAKPLGVSTLPLIQKMMHSHRAARAKIEGIEKPFFIPAGEVLPDVEARLGSHGPGVVQIQTALIDVGAMSASAICCRAGVFGPKTTQAIQAYKVREGIPSEPHEHGTFTNAVRESLLSALVDTHTFTTQERSKPKASDSDGSNHALSPEPQRNAESADDDSTVDTSEKDGHSDGGHTSISSGERWEIQLKNLADMGFLDTTRNRSLLERHNGSMELVIGALV